MKIGIQTWGSDGDILPFLALARGLRVAGHQVTVVYTSVDNKDYSAHARESGVEVVKAYERFDEGKAKIFAEIVDTKDTLKELALILESYFEPAISEMYAAAEKLCRENDLVVGHGIHYPLAVAAEKAGRPRVSVALCPMAIESKYVSPFGGSMGKWLNALLWKLGDSMVRKKIYQAGDRLRAREGLPPFVDMQKDLYVTRELTLIASSASLCPRFPDWGDNIQICGFLNPPKTGGDWQMPSELRRFLDDGEPPVYFTFGSCTQFDLERSSRLFVEAAKQAGVRAIVQSAWQKLPPMADDPQIFRAEALPHDQVFPHCAMVVHHGGAGTTQSSLLAGCPSVVVAHAFDQIFWAKTLQRAGVAGRPLLRRATSAASLAEAIRTVARAPDMARNAQQLGTAMAKENGVARAVALIEERFKGLV